MYAPLLCGLARRGEVLRIGTVFASTFLRAVKFLEGHGRAICADIRAGHVEAIRGADPVCRKAAARMVAGPEPALAGAAECAALSWRGIVCRL